MVWFCANSKKASTSIKLRDLLTNRVTLNVFQTGQVDCYGHTRDLHSWGAIIESTPKRRRPWYFSWFFSVSQNSTSVTKYATTASFHILLNLLFTHHRTFRHCCREISHIKWTWVSSIDTTADSTVTLYTKDNVIPVADLEQDHDDVWASGGKNLHTKRRLVARFTFQLLWFRGNKARYLLDTGLGESHLSFAVAEEQRYLRGLRRPPRLKWILPSSELSRGARWSEKDVSELPTGHIFEGEAAPKKNEFDRWR